MRTRTVIVLLVLLAFSALPALSQQTEKRTEVELLPVGPPAKELGPRPWGLYDFHTTLEAGVQVANTHGNNEVYRSQVNYSDGFRVFGFRFEGKANAPGAFFTRMFAEAGGWGGDPYNWFRYGLSKDKWFDFKASYVRSDYFFFNPGYARNQRGNDQQRRRQNYDFTLFPQRKLRFRLGYFRNSSFGPTFTTNDIENTRDAFFLLEPLRQTSDEYRIGAEWNIQRWSFLFDYSWRHFRNDRLLILDPTVPPNPGNTISAASAGVQDFIERAYPGRGHVPFVRFTVTGRPHKTLDVSARIVYSRAKFDYTRFEINDGRTFDPSGAPPPVDYTRTWLSSPLGDIVRPNTVADFSVVWRPVRELTFSNTFRFNGFDIAGADLTNIITTAVASPAFSGPLAPPAGGEAFYRLFDVDYMVNRFEIRYDPVRWLGLRVGHRHTHRDTNVVKGAHEDPFVECIGAFLPACTGGTLVVEPFEEEPAKRVTNTLLLGGDFRPHKTFTLFVDYERGGIDSVFNRIRRGRRLTARVRGRWEPAKGYRFSASWVQFDLRAPSPDVDSNQRNRGFTLDFALTKWDRFYWDIGYARNDVSSFTQIGRRTSATVFLLVDGPTGANCTLVAGEWILLPRNIPCRPSTYIDNNNYAYIDFGGRIVGNLHGEIGYRVFSATGTYLPSDPEGDCPLIFRGPCNVYPTAPAWGTVRVEWGGLNYHQPHASLRYVFSDNVSWKAGWRWYGYNVKIGTASDYRAHIVTTSLLLSF